MASFLKGSTATELINTCVANTVCPLHYKDMIIPNLQNDLGKQKIIVRPFGYGGYLEQPTGRTQSLESYSTGKGPGTFLVYCWHG